MIINSNQDPSWLWASGADKAQLEARKKELDTFMLKSRFWQQWNLLNTDDLKKMYDTAENIKDLDSMPSLLELIGGLESKLGQLISMQTVRLQYY